MSPLPMCIAALGVIAGMAIGVPAQLESSPKTVTELNRIGMDERQRQQDIQVLVCEAEKLDPCPTVSPWQE